MLNTIVKVNGHKSNHINTDMTMAEYQARMSETIIYKWPIIYPSMALFSEAGEISGAISKMIRDHNVRFDGNHEISDKERSNLCLEMGDVLWCLTALAQDLGLTLEMVATANLEKLADRKQRGVLKGSGDYR